jgi:hypothetical protein
VRRQGIFGMLGICLAITAVGAGCGIPSRSSTSDGGTVASPAPTASTADPSPTTGTADSPSDADFNPAHFTHSTTISHPYFPMSPGTKFRWEGHAFDDGVKVSRAIEFTVTDQTKMIDGVRTVVAQDRDITNGEAEEVELTFYAQDDSGTVWYFGEYSEEYDDNKIVKSPVWLAGLRDARPGIMMPAQPRTHTRDWAEGWGGSDLHWDDRAKVHRTGLRDCGPTGCYNDVVVLDEFNPREPGQHQLKYFAPRVGGIRTGWSGENETEREELALVSRRQLGPAALADLREDVRDEEKRAYERSPHAYAKTSPMEQR